MTRHIAVCLFSWMGLIAQDGPFRVQTNVVQVPAIVTDRNGRNVDGLVAKDFRVLDDGIPQKVALDDYSSGLGPISLVIAVQTSGLSTPALTKIRRIAGMIQPLVIGLRGEAAIVAFDGRIKWLQDFTPDDDKIREAVTSLSPAAVDQARMLDAVAQVAQHMEERKGRKLLLLISESRDRGSETTFRQSLEAVERQGIEVFGAHYSAYATSLIAKPKDLPEQPPMALSNDHNDWPEGPPGVDFLAIFSEIARLGKTNAIQALTRMTGGSDFPFTKERGIENAIEKLGAEVHSQYILSFPQNQNSSGIHRIDVSVPNRDDLRIRSRRTYSADVNGKSQ